MSAFQQEPYTGGFPWRSHTPLSPETIKKAFAAQAAKPANDAPLTGWSLGRHGTPEDLRTAASADVYYEDKAPIVRGAVAAYNDGKPENLRAFLGAYLGFKTMPGDNPEDFNDGFNLLVATPVRSIVDGSRQSTAVLRDLLSEMTEDQRKAALNIVLRGAVFHQAETTVHAALEEGADPNTYRGVCVWNGFRRNNVYILRDLKDHGADFDHAAKYWEIDSAKMENVKGIFSREEAMRAKRTTAQPQQVAEPTPKAPETPVLPLTPAKLRTAAKLGGTTPGP